MVCHGGSKEMNCPECGVEMLQLQPWDFLKCVCLNPVHKEPLIFEQTWCHDPTTEHRQLTQQEQEMIDKRKVELIKRLGLELDNWELFSVVNCFLGGGIPMRTKNPFKTIDDEEDKEC